MRRTPLLISNAHTDTAATLPVRDPFTGQTIAEVAQGGPAEIEAALAAAHAAFSITKNQPAHRRAELLLAVAAAIGQRRAEFAETIVAEAGKPITYAEAEVARAIVTFTAAAEEARRAQGEVLPLDAWPVGQSHTGWTRRLPLGVIAALTPFNFPLNLVAHKVAPALATGNTMIVKPSPRTPLTALLLGEVLVAAGMPAGQVNIVTCPNDLVAPLITDARVKMTSFTGSPAVGWPLKALVPKQRVTLELGGNAAVVVHRDADLAAAVPAIAAGAFAQAGQSCISVQRIFVHEEIHADFRARLLAHTAAHIRTGDPRLRETVVGPLISPEALALVQEKIQRAVAAGATILHGGKPSGPCLEPTILEGAEPPLEVCTGELFAPVATLHRYADFDDALRRVNDSAFGLQAGIFTRDLDLAFRAHAALDMGAVLVNQVPTWRVETMPYGGVKDSGFGREGLRYAMEDMTEPRAMIVRLGS